MPMIGVYAAAGTFPEKHKLARDLANAVMRWEKVPPINLFTKNTATFIHDMPAEAIAKAAGDSNYVRVQVLTPVGVLDRDKQLGVVRELLIDQRPDGVYLSYDLMASLLAPWGNAEALAVARQLDDKVVTLLTAAAE